ncbi:MAG TPA: DNA replication and repair protein RecF [Flavobacteriales bacterium]|nr:DNA replication and repair protein RecF [Flavobacteriales bacterium]
MQLARLSLFSFKNISDLSLEFCPGVNCLLGDNGEGKTNILDAIHYLSFCKSYFNLSDIQNIKHGESFFMVQGLYEEKGESVEVSCSQKKGQKKRFKRNKKEYDRLSDHIGQIPLVMISPADADLINEGSEVRRKFIDTIISQYDRHYLEQLIDYNKVLAQRNALLKRFGETGSYSQELLEVWDIRLVELARTIHANRHQFLSGFSVLFTRFFRIISGGKEEVTIDYKSDLSEDDFFSVLKRSLPRDRATEYTQVGIHKDDLIFKMGGHPIKRFGSQGQQKSFLIALKIAQYYHLLEVKGKAPILLLDDIFDKLDEHRVSRMMEMVTAPGFGQVFVTDTDREKLPRLLDQLKVEHKEFIIEQGALA